MPVPSSSPRSGVNPYSFTEQLKRLIELEQGMGRHARNHERNGFDAARLSVQSEGVPMPLQVTLNFKAS
jgi:hypothetical protein